MKKVLLSNLIRNLKANPSLLRKVKVFAVVGLIGILLTGTLIVLAVVSAFNFLADKAVTAMDSHQTTAHVEKLRTEVTGLSFQSLSCWQEVQRLMAVEPWLARPTLVNLKNLKVACLEGMKPVCEEPNCTEIKKPKRLDEGSFI